MVILIDSSVWIEYLRRTGSPAAAAVRTSITDRSDDIVMCEPIAMELLAGARDDLHHAKLQRLVNGLPSLALRELLDFREASDIYRAGRQSGCTIRKLLDCVIAVVAIHHNAELWHRDADFDVIASLTPLRVRSFVQSES